MLMAEQARAKVFELAQFFNHHYTQGEWWRAKNAYDTAVTISVFMEFSEDDKIKLYGNRPYAADGDELTEGLFEEEKVQKCYFECIRLNQARENEIFRSPTEQKIGR